MEIFVVKTSNAIFTDKLLDTCQAYRQTEYALYESVNFIEGTGYVKTVAEEIDLVLSSNSNQGIYLTFDDFVKSWQLSKYLDYDLSALSGGWRKYLGLALFTNLQHEGKVYIDATRQLSDKLIQNLLANLALTQTQNSFFFEYDSHLIKHPIVSFLYLENDVLKLNVLAQRNSQIEETNYEYLKNQ